MRVLIQGATRGIGLAMVRELLREPEVTVVATHRSQSASLEQLRLKYRDRLYLQHLDVTLEESIASAAATVASVSPFGLDLLINFSGVLHTETMSPERRIEHASGDSLALSFAVHATGPLLMAKHFFPLLKHERRAVFASLSARVGSIGDNRLGGWYGYRASKAAQNMLTKTLSIEFARRAPNLICLGLHPGTVDTDLSKPFQRNVPTAKLFDTTRAAQQLLAVIAATNSEDSGTVLDWRGEPIPW